MCLVIEPDVILANLFLAGKERVTPRDLTQIRSKIEAVKGGIFIEISMKSIYNVVDQRPDMFVWDGDCVRRAANSDLFTDEYVDEYFNYKIPKDLINIVREAA